MAWPQKSVMAIISLLLVEMLTYERMRTPPLELARHKGGQKFNKWTLKLSQIIIWSKLKKKIDNPVGVFFEFFLINSDQVWLC